MKKFKISPRCICGEEILYLPFDSIEEVKESYGNLIDGVEDLGSVDVPEENCIRCNNCDIQFGNPPIKPELYDTPWDESPEEYEFCSELCVDSYKGRFTEKTSRTSYFECPLCERTICEQNPANGWMVQYRTDLIADKKVCLRCYQDNILENGIARDVFLGGISGMFFNHGNPEALDAGYEPVPGFSYFHVNSIHSRNKVCNKAIALIDSGHKVICGFERMAYGGGEGYITLLSKKGDES